MDLAWEIEIVDQLIEEDPGTTIKEYVQLIDDVTRIIPKFNSYNEATSPHHTDSRRPL